MQAEMLYKRLHFWILLRKMVLMHVSVVHVVMKRKQERKNVFSRFVMSLDNGILSVKDQNFGISLMVKFIRERMFVFSQSLIGRNWMYGITSNVKISRCLQSISVTSVM